MPGLAAFVALIFSYQASKATDTQLQIAERGQITDRYTAAITDLGSPKDVRIGGIYALQHLMQDSPRDYQSTVIAVLCAFVRDRSTSTRTPQKLPEFQLATDIQAAVTVVGTRNTANDGHVTVADLDHTQLARGRFVRDRLGHADLYGADLEDADLTSANLTSAVLTSADLTGAVLSRTDLTGAKLRYADLDSANLTGANLRDADLHHAHLRGAELFDAHMTGTSLWGADLARADLEHAHLADATLFKADLTRANITDADLTHANLADANLTHANVAGAHLGGADLTGAGLQAADLTRAILTDANFADAHLKDALWPADAAVPEGWLRDIHTGRLSRSGS